jgi:5-carboxymethyl-2-hydroxymuconic-semialdehyde dehydrogenase
VNQFDNAGQVCLAGTRLLVEASVAGTVWVNCFFVRDLRAPFGGSRDSGIGREGGTWSFDFYADVKNVVTAPRKGD